MAFEGWLLKINGVVFPNSLIKFNTYRSIPNQVTEVDSYTDADGRIHRNVYPHKATRIEFQTKTLMFEDKLKLKNLIPIRTELELEYWNDESDCYETGVFYVPDLTFEIYHIDRPNNTMIYNPVGIAFVEY